MYKSLKINILGDIKNIDNFVDKNNITTRLIRHTSVNNKLFYVRGVASKPIGPKIIWLLFGTNSNGEEYYFYSIEEKIGKKLEDLSNKIVIIDASSKRPSKFLMIERIEKAE